MSTANRPIGFFDSGVGGLTVLREVIRRLPAESTIYLGDNLRAPYGPRSDEEVERFSLECLDELAARDVKAIVVACNTASAVALRQIRRRFDLPILGVVRPGAAAAALATRARTIGVIATAATIRSHAYFQAIKDENPFLVVHEHATPELVPLVEAGRLDGPEVEAAVERALGPLLAPDGHRRRPEGDGTGPGIDTLLLGCTHYPLLAGPISAAAGEGIAVIDSATATASALAALLEANGLQSAAADPPIHLQLTTGDVERFRWTARRLFGDLFPAVEPIRLPGQAVPVQPVAS